MQVIRYDLKTLADTTVAEVCRDVIAPDSDVQAARMADHQGTMLAVVVIHGRNTDAYLERLAEAESEMRQQRRRD